MKQIEEAKLFEYWRGSLSEEEAREIKAALENDPSLSEKYKELELVFRTLGALKAREFTPERNLAAPVFEKVNSLQGEIWRLYMKKKEVFTIAAASCCILLALFLTRSTPVSIYETENGKQYQAGEGQIIVLKEVKKQEVDDRSRPDVSVASPVEPASEPAKNKPLEQLEKLGITSSDLIGKGKIEAKRNAQGVGPAAADMHMSDEYAHVPLQRGFMPPYPNVGGTEQYGEYKQQTAVSPREQQLSTFSIDVDTASYTNMRRFLKMGQLPPQDSIRAEEFINYFDYKYETSYEKPFAVTYEMAPSPFRKNKHIVRLGLKAKEVKQDNSKGWNLVFLVDVSGSMASQDKLPLVQQALRVIVDKMRAQDKISIVTYAGYDRIALEPTSGADKTKIHNVIDSLLSAGGTNGAAGIETAYQLARNAFIPGSVNRVIIATDGDFNVGNFSFEGLMKLIEEKRKTGITLTTVGVGQGNLNDKMLEQLANRGNGNYIYLDSFREARRAFSDELTSNMVVVAKDVKLQVEFNPAKVRRYRLIGYDNRILAKEDFSNDTVDAGEIGSGHTVTALYEVELVGSPADAGDDLRYADKVEDKKPTQDLHPAEIGFLKVRFKQPESDTSELSEFPMPLASEQTMASGGSEDFRFANSVAAFAELLRNRGSAKDLSLNSIAELAKAAKGADSTGKRAEFLELVEDAKRLLPE